MLYIYIYIYIYIFMYINTSLFKFIPSLFCSFIDWNESVWQNKKKREKKLYKNIKACKYKIMSDKKKYFIGYFYKKKKESNFLSNNTQSLFIYYFFHGLKTNWINNIFLIIISDLVQINRKLFILFAIQDSHMLFFIFILFFFFFFK